MKLIKEISEAILADYQSYKEVYFYIDKWHIVQTDWNNHWENFGILTTKDGEIDLLATLHNIDGETLLKIAIDLGVDTPDFIPTIPTFRNEIKSDYKTASATFEKAFKQIGIHPDIAIGLANSALESIIKEIFKGKRIINKPKQGKTLYDLTVELLKELQLFPRGEMPIEVRTIGSSLMSVNQSIEKLRSTKTGFHGKTNDDYIIKDPLYAYFILNSVSTVGIFLINYYKGKFPPEAKGAENIFDDIPF